uniref:F-box protein At5g07610-like n=1 Tax=Erigeron canadensis TaxID=72917 RepID=UPI001CB9A4F9|nr:F-box protein At5g07610-like [Erigeron canadensis]
MWLDSTGMKKKNKSTAFTFGCFGSDASKVEVLQSCNGLILCGIRTDPADKIYVYNPSNNVFKMLPPILNMKYNRQLDKIRLAFDPTKSPHYKVLHAQQIGYDPIRRRPYWFQTRIYSSETSCWRSCSIKYPTQWFSGYFYKGVYWNDAIHWLDHWNRVRHFKLDVEHPPDTTTQIPITLHWNNYKELFESCGCLLFASYAGDYHPKCMEIYEMRNGYTGWSLRYIVNYEESSLAAFLKMQKMSSVKFSFKFLFIVVGEREEESFVVMEVCRKIVKYNLLLKSLHTLCDMDIHYLTDTFSFIASFASV